MPENPVAKILDPLQDGKMTVGIDPNSRRQIGTKIDANGEHIQKCTLVEAVAQAELTMANTEAVEGNTGEIGELNGNVRALGPKVDAQTDAVKANTQKLTDVEAKLTEANTYAKQTAAQAMPGLPYWNDWNAIVGAVTLKAPDPDHDAKVLRCVVSATSLLGSLLGGGAKVILYYCNGKDDLYTAAGAVVIGYYPIASGASYPVGNGRIVPKGKYLRAHATNGNCGISVDVA